MKKRDHLLILIELLFTLSFLAILGYMLNVPSGLVIGNQYTLRDYPKPFLDNSNYNFIFTTSDTVNQDEYNCALTILSGMKEISTSDIEQDLVPLGDGISNNHLKSSIRSQDLAALQSGSVSLAGNTINVHDEINLGKLASSLDTTSPSLETGLTKNKQYQSSIYLDTVAGSISYHYVFENTIDLSKINENNPLTINFLGKDLTITSVNSDSEFIGLIGKEQLVKINDQFNVEDGLLRIEDIGQDSIIVNVNGQKEIISKGGIKKVGNIQVVVSNIVFNDKDSTAAIVVGNQVSDSYKSSQNYGTCEQDCFVWDINNLLTKSSGDIYAASGPTIGIKNGFSLAGKISPSNCIDFPDNFAKLCFDSLTTDKYSNYRVAKETLDVSTIMPQLSSQDVISISSGHQEGIAVKTSGFIEAKSSDKKTSKIYLRANNSNSIDVFYEDSGLKWAGTYQTGNKIQIAAVDFDNTAGDDIKIYSQGTISTPEIVFSPTGTSITNDDIIIRLKSSLTGISKVFYGSDNKDISDYDLDSRNQYGIILYNIKNGVDDNDLELAIPDTQIKAKIKLNGLVIAKQQQANKLPEIIQGSSLSDYNQNIIAIGRSNIIYNKINPGGWQYPSGTAIINLINNNKYYTLLVAGSTNEDLSRACNLLANYYQNRNKLKGVIAKV